VLIRRSRYLRVTCAYRYMQFMEHDEKALPIDVRVLGALASRVGAYAKALHYKEMEYHNTENPGA